MSVKNKSFVRLFCFLPMFFWACSILCDDSLASATGGGKLSFIDNGNRSYYKLEVASCYRNKEGKEYISAGAIIGKDNPDFGITCKPNTNYTFSIEVNPQVPWVLKIHQWNKGNTFWQGRDLKTPYLILKQNTFLPGKSGWFLCKGRFRTGPEAEKTAIRIYLWDSGEPLKYKKGDCVFFRNLKITEWEDLQHAALPPYRETYPASSYPRGPYKKNDIERARQNIQQYNWAKKIFENLKNASKFWLECPEDKIAYWIPDDGGYDHAIRCPKCNLPGYMAWGKNADDKGMTCTKCNLTFPNAAYPEDKFVEVTTPTGKKKKIFFHERNGQRYMLSHVQNACKLRKLSLLHCPAMLYALTNNLQCAAKVRSALLRFAAVYPDYPPRWKTTPANSYAEIAHPWGGKVDSWKISDANMIRNLGLTYDLTLNSGLYTENDRKKIKRGIFLEYKKMLMTFDLQDEVGNALPLTFNAIAIASVVLGDWNFFDWLLNEPAGLKDFGMRFFTRNGNWYESSPSYTKMALSPFSILFHTIDGVSCPDGTMDVRKQFPWIKNMYALPAYGIMPTGKLPAIGDSYEKERYSATFAEFAYTWNPNPDTEQLRNLFADRQPGIWEFDTLFKSTHDFGEKKGKQGSTRAIPWFMRQSLVLSGNQWAILREQSGDSALLLNFENRKHHGHNASLSYLYYDFSKELVHDLGYLSAPHPNTPFLTSPTTHNIVIVDGMPQAHTRKGKLLLFSGSHPVKAVSAAMTDIYKDVTGYCRTLVMIKHPDGAHFVIDRFKVTGGREHNFVYHANGPFFTPAKTCLKSVDPRRIGSEQLKTTFLKNAVETISEKMLKSTWFLDPDRKTGITLFLLPAENKTTRYIHAVGPGMRDFLKNEKTDLHIAFHLRKGPINTFLSVVESFSGTGRINEIIRLNENCIAVTSSGKYTDILIFNPEGKPMTLVQYPDFYTDGRIAVITLCDNQVKSLYLAGGTNLRIKGKEIHGRPEIRGTVLDVRDHKLITNLKNIPNEIIRNNYIIFPEDPEGIYRVQEANGNTLALSPDENIGLVKNDKFFFIPSYYREWK